MILFLDFDGVLHHADVFLSKQPGKLGELPKELVAEGHQLFQHAGVLEEALTQYPDLEIVLSTSWAHKWGWERASKQLPISLMKRCIGQTQFVYGDWMDGRCRGQQVTDHAKSMGLELSQWIALDDDVAGWPDEAASRLVATHPVRGLADAGPLARLQALLAGADEVPPDMVFEARQAELRAGYEAYLAKRKVAQKKLEDS